MFRISLAFALVFIALLWQGCTFARELVTPYPTDRMLETRLSKHREDFEVIVRLFEEDAGVWQIDSDVKPWIGREKLAELPKGRIDRYRELMRRTGVLTISRDYPNNDKPQRPIIYMNVWDINTHILHGSMKSYVYKHKDDSKLINSLDEMHDAGKRCDCYKKIDEDWRLFLDIY